MESRWSERRRRRIAGGLALVASLLVHALAGLSFRGIGRLPAVELTIVEPNEAEFGVIEPAPLPAAAASPPPAPELTRLEHAGVKPAKPRAVPERAPAAAQKPAGVKNDFPEAGEAGRFAPHGSQIALRLDVERIETGPLAEEVRALVSALPDVRWLLAGSGVDPLHDLSRLFVASPDLRREHVVLAGRYRGATSVVRDAVQRLAERQGQPVRWRTQRGISVAPWFNQPNSPHMLALLGSDMFAITRENDLARVLAIARAIPTGRSVAASGLIHMDEHELLNLSVENARSFTRGPRNAQVPDRLAVSVRSESNAASGVQLAVSAHYPDATQASAAFQYWDELRTRYASHTLLALFGVGSILRDARLSSHGERISLQLQVSRDEARMLLRWARDSLHPHMAATHD